MMKLNLKVRMENNWKQSRWEKKQLEQNDSFESYITYDLLETVEEIYSIINGYIPPWILCGRSI